jgi:hypothetical protein
VFDHADGLTAFCLTLLPMNFLLLTMYLFRRQVACIPMAAAFVAVHI